MANQYVIWGIEDSQISIPAGSLITEAVLTITVAWPPNTPFYVYLLDNPKPSLEIGTDTHIGDIFASYGITLSGIFEDNNWICRFSQNNNIHSPIRKVFSESTSIILGDSTSVVLSSSLLELMDYAGNGRGFGIGIEFADSIPTYITGMRLDITIQSFVSADLSELKLSYDIPGPSGDINHDTRVDLKDIASLSQNWLVRNCQSADYCKGCDINMSGSVDMADLVILIENWLQ